MAEFECTLCGRCCMGMGRYVKITGVMGQGTFAAVHSLSNEVFYAHIPSEYRDRVSLTDRDTPETWCPFLLDADENGRYICAAYDSRPSFCKKYRCASMRIVNTDGKCVGTVRGKTGINTEDKALKALWDKEASERFSDDISEYIKNLNIVLKPQGYTVEEYD